MSMHRIPLTPIEEAGLKAHGLDIGTPSQLSDVFRQGVAWTLSQQTGLVEALGAVKQRALATYDDELFDLVEAALADQGGKA
jgi:hypothetical protein